MTADLHTHYVNRTVPDGEVEAFVDSLLSQGWAVAPAEPEEGAREVHMSSHKDVKALRTKINSLCRDGYTVFDYGEQTDAITNEVTHYLEAWRITKVWRVTAWRGAGTMAA